MNKLLVWILRAYQLVLSPMLGQNCRFYPSCSSYAIEAIRTHGSARGSFLAARRVCRCHPWNDGGLDPVPPKLNEGGPDPVPPKHDKNSSTAACCNHS